MPSSMIFVGLVVMWLLILVPAVARRRQEVARPSVTALSGRVLERTPRRGPDTDRNPPAGRDVEVDVRHEQEPAHAVAARTETERRSRRPAPPAEPRDRAANGLDGWTWRDLDGDAEDAQERRPASGRAAGSSSRFRPGRGGYDPEAAALAARARCAFRQRVVLLLFILAVGSAVAAVFVLPALWWTHGALDIGLVGYLVYLRRQVRVEEAIRKRRSARVGAPRRAAENESDGPRRDQPRRRDDVPSPRKSVDGVEPTDGPPAPDEDADEGADPEGSDSRTDRDTPTRVPTPTTPDPAESAEPVRPALPLLKPIPTPPVPIGTTLVDGEEDDPALHELERVTRPDYRRASGQ